MKTSRPGLQFLQSLSVSVGMAFATSCFAMVAGMASATGPWVLVAIAASVAIAVAVAHAIGRLAKRFPSALGIRTYIKAAFGNTASLFFVFLYLFMIATIAGVESYTFASIVRFLMPRAETQLVIAGMFAVVLAMNAFGFEFSRKSQLAMVLALLACVLGLSGYALAVADLQPALIASSGGPRLGAVPAAIITAFFLFVGFEWVTSSQSGSRSAAAQLPRVLLCSVLLLGVVYLVFSAAAILHLSHDELKGTNMPQMLLAARLCGHAGCWVMLGASALAVMTGFNAGLMGAARMLYVLAREGVLPRALGATAGCSGAPVAGIVAATVVCMACALLVRHLGAVYLLGSAAAVVICLCYGALLAASLKLHRTHNVSVARGWPRGAQLSDSCALAVMVLLLAALVFGDRSFRPTQLVLAAVLVLMPLAAFANRRSVRLAG